MDDQALPTISLPDDTPLHVGMAFRVEAFRREPDGSLTPLWEDTAVMTHVEEVAADGDEHRPE